MSSLQDQLLKAGLIDTKKAKTIQKEQRKQTKMQHKSKDKPPAPVKVAAEEARLHKLQKDQELNDARNALAHKKAIAAQIKQLIDLNKQPRSGDVAYNFTDGTTVKKILINPALQKSLLNGQLAIAKHGDGYELVPHQVANKIIERDGSFIVSQAVLDAHIEQENDPYADFQIPDDLMW
ncbi:MAG: hypothetical protein RL497_1459 [Pseudomonadota bacterium]|jgi:uncharacterized protein YaiL (DUF2058 family)